MAYADVKLRPGVTVDWTPTLNEAGISQSQLIRFRDGLVQKYGGWSKFFSLAIGGIPRDLHAWQDLNSVDHLAVGDHHGVQCHHWRVHSEHHAADIHIRFCPEFFDGDEYERCYGC